MTVKKAPAEKGKNASKGAKGSKGGKGDLAVSRSETSLSADELRVKVVARVEENLLNALEAKALSAEATARTNTDSTVRSQAAAEASRLRNVAKEEALANCKVMARPGVVMGEDELQALADVRQACVEVHF